MVAPAIAAAAISAGGALAGGGISSAGSLRQLRENRAAAREQMEFQYNMYRHRYRMTMNDMREAGLNPILAYSQGPGSTPMGATWSAPNVGEGLGQGVAAAAEKGVSSALQARRLSQELRNMKELEKTEGTKQTLNRAVMEKNWTAAEKDKADIANTRQATRNLVRQYSIMGADLASARAVEYMYNKYPELRQFEVFRRGFGLGAPRPGPGFGPRRKR